jgi:squalene-hopene/tetraprenyl-beta-curcumene cyclase
MLANRSWKFPKQTSTFTLENGFLYLDKILKNLLKFPNPFKGTSSNQCIQYIREHIEKTEDIYPAMAYSALALKALGFSSQDATIQKCLKGLFNFQQLCEGDLPHIPRVQTKEEPLHATLYLHQQCCISPVWDTPWAGVSLLESGLNPEHPSLQKASDWLLKKQIKHVYGDWSIKNKKAKPGGWSFEFENDYFPDVDDTIEVLTLLYQTGLNSSEQKESFQLGLDWLLSMQSKNGGWAAFDVDNTLDLVNRIPFSDHGACLDPPTPDITGRMLEFLALIQFDKNSPVIKKAIQFIYKTQTSFGAWEGRWGVDYLYGTWCVLQGLAAIGENHQDSQILQAKDWLVKTQLPDGGWGESCLSYQQKQFVPLSASVPSQTAWATMGLLAVGEVDSVSVSRGIEFLLDRQNSHGCWDEKEYTGTGFPGHFYIRYHGYRHYFPLLALGKFQKRLNSCNS